MPKIWDSFDYKVAGSYVMALEYGADSCDDFTDKEVREFNDWVQDCRDNAASQGWTPAHWTYDSEYSENWGICAVTGLSAMRVCVKLMVYKDKEE